MKNGLTIWSMALNNYPPLKHFSAFLLMNWADPKNAKQHRPILSKIGNKAAEAGYVWIEAEASALAAAWSKDGKENKKRSEMLHDELGTSSLVYLVTPVPKWEKCLNALIRMGEDPAPNLGDEDDIHTVHGQKACLVVELRRKVQYLLYFSPFAEVVQKGSLDQGKSSFSKKFTK